jgi:hypothetical protein
VIESLVVHDNARRRGGAAEAYAPMGVQFSEALDGFAAAGADLTFAEGFAQGKAAGLKMGFKLDIAANPVPPFLEDPSHLATAVGSVHVTGLTPEYGANVVNGTMGLFSGGIANHTAHLFYTLPFLGEDGNPYTLMGEKFVYGDRCVDVFAEMTTLYTYIVHGHQIFGANATAAGIVRTGISVISPLRVLELFASVRTLGSGTDADRVNALVQFFGFAYGVLERLCLTWSNYQYQFWYMWGSTGSEGFLLDMIKQPDQLELRLDLYNASATPGGTQPPAVVTREFLPLSAYRESAGGTVTMGPLTLTPTSCVGTVGGITVNLSFALGDTEMHFVPAALEKRSDGLLIDVVSRYGHLLGGRVGNGRYSGDLKLPTVLTTYPIKAGIDVWRWAMISALSFEGTDLQVEIMATRIAGIWLATAYVLFDGKVHKVDDPFLLGARMPKRGDIIGDDRVFTAEIKVARALELTVSCSAPRAYFAMLDKEGSTEIHTTVLGACNAADAHSGRKDMVSKSALLEVKGGGDSDDDDGAGDR